MLSVCIPVYNSNIDELLMVLENLLSSSGLEYEIVVADDGSSPDFIVKNELATSQYGARFISLGKNVGRSAIRNFLGIEARFENILFLDCDSLIVDDHFILNYMPFLNQNMVVYGGTVYQIAKPDSKFRLHWHYGNKREIKPATVRNLRPEKYFKTNNFLVSKRILKRYPFNEGLKGYGHEDTLMGITLFQNDVPVFHIENPVLHAGLETGEAFISKTETAIRNLLDIYNHSSNSDFTRFISLLAAFSKIKKFKMVLPIRLFWLISRPFLLFLVKNFYSMRALDIYKLGFFCSIYKKSTTLSSDAFLLK